MQIRSRNTPESGPNETCVVLQVARCFPLIHPPPPNATHSAFWLTHDADLTECVY